MILITKKGKEDYELLSACFGLLNLNLTGCKLFFGGDQKFLNLIHGIGAHRSTFPCVFCVQDSSHFEDGAPADLRTYGDIRKYCRMFQESKVKAKSTTQPKTFFNCIREPLLPFSDETRVLDCVCVPELHVLLRSFNGLWKSMAAAWENCLGTGLTGSSPLSAASMFAISVNAVSKACRNYISRSK